MQQAQVGSTKDRLLSHAPGQRGAVGLVEDLGRGAYRPESLLKEDGFST
jgi:hypothetical protein